MTYGKSQDTIGTLWHAMEGKDSPPAANGERVPTSSLTELLPKREDNMRPAKEPWFRKGRGWFVQHKRKKIFLGHDKQTAQRLFHQLMATGSLAPAVSNSTPVVTILD